MDEFWTYFSNAWNDIPDYPRWANVVVIAAIILITQFLKIPIKKWTDKSKVEVSRERKNAIIMLIPFALGLAASGIFMIWNYDFSLAAAKYWGLASQVTYIFFSRIFARIKKGETITVEDVKQDLNTAKQETQTNADEAAKELTHNAEETFDNLVSEIQKNISEK